MKILMVCLGNICRSPLAEGILRRKIEELNLDWEVDSAGTGSWHIGERPDRRSIQVASRHGIDISTQRARQINPRDLDRFDLILAMDRSNFQDVIRMARTDAQRSKVAMILNYVQPGANEGVPDPYWDDDGFDHVFHLLTEACDQVVSQLKGDG